MIRSGTRCTLWKADNTVLTEDALDSCLADIEDCILPRVSTIWGNWADIDSDGKIALLLCPSINEERVALGFFNPSDFFARNADSTSAHYNPYSNEMDVLYLAVPDSNEDSPYWSRSISATVAHELTHAVNFTQKTWNRVASGETSAPQEELFLDEGWSHLSENLCGFGISGGNIKFLQRFLSDTGSYSFCGVNSLGQADSAGMRGAMTLFLSWLFWKKGGMSWESENPVSVIDTGGISFLRHLVARGETGWESIGSAFGIPTDSLFTHMIYELNRECLNASPFAYKTDPRTGEPVEFFADMGTVSGGSTPVEIGTPNRAVVPGPRSILPWSFQFYATFSCPALTPIDIRVDSFRGNVYQSALWFQEIRPSPCYTPVS